MDKNKSSDHFRRKSSKGELTLPALTSGLEACLGKGHTFSVTGTNVVRVPFGVRKPRKQRPQRAENRVTLVLPFQPQGNPTPPPQAA